MSGAWLVTAATARGLEKAGLLVVSEGCTISDLAVFRPVDDLGQAQPIVLNEGCSVGAFAIVHGGTKLCEGVRVEDHVIIGQPERGYAVHQNYPGAAPRPASVLVLCCGPVPLSTPG